MDFDRLKYSVWIQKCVHPNVDTKFENADTDADTDVGTDFKKIRITDTDAGGYQISFLKNQINLVGIRKKLSWPSSLNRFRSRMKRFPNHQLETKVFKDSES